MITDTKNDKLPSPDNEVRADLWGTMSASQLHRQQDLVLERLNRLRTIAGEVPSATGLIKVLTGAMSELTALIDSKTATPPTKGPTNGQ